MQKQRSKKQSEMHRFLAISRIRKKKTVSAFFSCPPFLDFWDHFKHSVPVSGHRKCPQLGSDQTRRIKWKMILTIYFQVHLNYRVVKQTRQASTTGRHLLTREEKKAMPKAPFSWEWWWNFFYADSFPQELSKQVLDNLFYKHSPALETSSAPRLDDVTAVFSDKVDDLQLLAKTRFEGVVRAC